jgi:hypothetical protein
MSHYILWEVRGNCIGKCYKILNVHILCVQEPVFSRTAHDELIVNIFEMYASIREFMLTFVIVSEAYIS